MTEPVCVGKIVATRGNRGELAAVCPGGAPERLAQIRHVLLADGEGGVEAVELVANWSHKGRWVVRFPQVDSIGAAERFVGREIFLAEQDLPRLPPGRYYTYQLTGSRVVNREGRSLGTVRDTESGPAHDFLLVERPDGREAMVPMTPAIVVAIDTAAGQVMVDAPWGLLEGDAEEAG